MSLDLLQVAGQIEKMAAGLKAAEEKRLEKINFASETLHKQAAELKQLRQKIQSSKTTWLVADAANKLDTHETPPACPQDFVVLATDGSHIDVDRHRSAHCFLINSGTAELEYGKTPDARLYNLSSLYFEDKDTIIPSPQGNSYEQVEGALLGIRRSIEECRSLADSASKLDHNLPTLLLLDGSLILWGLAGQNYPEYIKQALVNEGFLIYLDEIRRLGQIRQLAIAAYISYPRSTEVTNILRLALCPYEPVDCDRYCSGRQDHRECDA